MRRPGADACARLEAAIDAYIEKAESDLVEELRRAGYEDPEGTMRFIQENEERLRGMLAEGNRRVISALGQIAKHSDVVDLKRWWELVSMPDGQASIWTLPRMASVFKEQMEEFMPRLITGYSHRIDHELAVEGMTRRTTAFIDGWSSRLDQLMGMSQKNQVGTLVKESIAKGESIDTLARKIREDGIRNTDATARRVALTETLRAHSYSQLEAYRLNPAVSKKRWRHTHAKFSKPRENHVAMDGVEVPVDDPFDLPGADGGVYHPQCPRDTGLPPGESINCHCLLQPVVDSGILGRPLEEREKMYREARAKCDADWERELNEQKRAQALEWRAEHAEDPSVELPDLKAAQKQRLEKRFTSKDFTLPEGYRKSLKKRYENGTELARKAYDKYVPDGGALWTDDEPGGAAFYPHMNKIKLNVRKDASNVRDAGSTWYHEHGHFVDYNAGADAGRSYASEDHDFVGALRKDASDWERGVKKQHGYRGIDEARWHIGQALTNDGDWTAGVQDILGGAIHRPYPGAKWSHSQKYWKAAPDERLAHESFANMFEALFDQKKAQLMAKRFPTAWKRFIEILEEVAK